MFVWNIGETVPFTCRFDCPTCFTRAVLPADYSESFHESTRVVTISSLLSALRLRWREAIPVIIVFKRMEKFVVKVDGESPPPQALLNYSLTFYASVLSPPPPSPPPLSLPFSLFLSLSLFLRSRDNMALTIWYCNNTIFAHDLKLACARARYFSTAVLKLRWFEAKKIFRTEKTVTTVGSTLIRTR